MATLQEYIKRLQDIRNGLLDGVFGVPAAKELEATLGRRIFLQGKATDGSAIGNYSTKPIYVNPNNPVFNLLPKFRKRKPALGTPVGKTGKKIFASTGLPHKTVYLKRGYLEFRERVGRQPSGKLQPLGNIATSGVNLNLTGSLAQNFTTGVTKGRVTLGFTSAVELRKAKGLEARFGKTIFLPSDKEIKEFVASVGRQVALFIKKKLEG